MVTSCTRTNCLLKHIIEGEIEGTIEVALRRGRRGKQLLCELKGNERILEIERRSTISRFVEKSLWKRLWTCRKADYGLMNVASLGNEVRRFSGNVLPPIQGLVSPLNGIVSNTTAKIRIISLSATVDLCNLSHITRRLRVRENWVR